jgi:acetoin:2,6-dichlorophenolindophenol oxidoreductase subunit alpha
VNAVIAASRRGEDELSPVGDFDLDLLLLIRHFERGILDLFDQGKLSGTTHTCLGQEYIPVALRPLLHADDYVFSNHRGHGHYLARFEDPAGLLAEIMGRQGAVCNGVGGSQHIHRDRYFSTGVQGESLPAAAGAAFHLKRAAPGALAAAFVGDGTFGEGAVYEALNMAQLWKVPLLIVVENNHIAQSTPSTANMAGTIEDRAAAFGLLYRSVRSNDIAAIRAELGPLIQTVRDLPRPAIAELHTVRVGPHSKGDDSRDDETRQSASAQDWYRLYESALGERFSQADARQRERVAAVIREVEARPLARLEP